MNMKFGTKVIHAGIEPDEATGAIMTPIYQTSTYVHTSPGQHKGYEYSRTLNPTRKVLEDNLAALENGKTGYCFSSGMAASDAVMKLLKPGDKVIATNDLYGGSYRLFTKVYEAYGIQFEFIQMSDIEQISSHIDEQTKMIWVETPTNPLLNIIDIKKVVELARSKNILCCVDNTFATPFLQRPLDLGADLVVHSLTKYLCGHSDVIMGAVVVNDSELGEKMAFYQNSCGAVPGPQDCFLILRGVKTLHLRMKAHCENTAQIAEFLNNHDDINEVYWPGLATHKNHDVASDQMDDFGGMLSFTFKDDDIEKVKRFLSNLKLFSLAESLGGVESLAGHPATMTHAAIPKSEREAAGLKDGLVRLSIGIEDVSDLIEDLNEAIKRS